MPSNSFTKSQVKWYQATGGMITIPIPVSGNSIPFSTGNPADFPTLPYYGSYHSTTANYAFGDGSVRPLGLKLEFNTFRKLMSRSGREAIPIDSELPGNNL